MELPGFSRKVEARVLWQIQELGCGVSGKNSRGRDILNQFTLGAPLSCRRSQGCNVHQKNFGDPQLLPEAPEALSRIQLSSRGQGQSHVRMGLQGLRQPQQRFELGRMDLLPSGSQIDQHMPGIPRKSVGEQPVCKGGRILYGVRSTMTNIQMDQIRPGNRVVHKPLRRPRQQAFQCRGWRSFKKFAPYGRAPQSLEYL